MEFTYKDERYRLEFRRVPEKSRRREVPKLATVVTLTRRTENRDPHGYPIWIEVMNGRARYNPIDPFSYHEGRLQALLKMIEPLERPFRKAIGNAYHGRLKRTVKIEQPTLPELTI